MFELGIPSADTLFIYVLEGEVSFTDFDDAIAHKNVVLFDKGDTFNVKSVTSESRILLFSAKPINEPVAWAGPIVMNTEAELEVAFAQLQRGTFVQDNHK